MDMGEGSAGRLREERRTVTVLSADIVGSTALGERLDPEDVRVIIGGAIARMVAAVEGLGGRVTDLAGDGVLALFGAPTAHEDDPERAVQAGLRIIRNIRESADALARGPDAVDLRVRVGIETGLVVLGPVGAGQCIEYRATGDAVNTAARLQSAGVPGTVLVGPRTHRP